jgi:hypothetical protein
MLNRVSTVGAVGYAIVATECKYGVVIAFTSVNNRFAVMLVLDILINDIIKRPVSIIMNVLIVI